MSIADRSRPLEVAGRSPFSVDTTDIRRVVSRAYGEPGAEWFTLPGRSNSAAHRDVGVAALD
jgi:hypothetical protein